MKDTKHHQKLLKWVWSESRSRYHQRHSYYCFVASKTANMDQCLQPDLCLHYRPFTTPLLSRTTPPRAQRVYMGQASLSANVALLSISSLLSSVRVMNPISLSATPARKLANPTSIVIKSAGYCIQSFDLMSSRRPRIRIQMTRPPPLPQQRLPTSFRQEPATLLKVLTSNMHEDHAAGTKIDAASAEISDIAFASAAAASTSTSVIPAPRIQ